MVPSILVKNENIMHVELSIRPLLVALGVLAVSLIMALSASAQIYTNPDFGADQAQNVRDANNVGTTTDGTGLPDAGTQGTTNGTTTPGLPNTGAGGDMAANIALMIAAAIVAFGGGMVLLKRKALNN